MRSAVLRAPGRANPKSAQPICRGSPPNRSQPHHHQLTDVRADVKRILDSSTGQFHDSFQSCSSPFIAIANQSRSTSVKTLTEASLESAAERGAQVLIVVSVTTTKSVVAEELPRAWRVRLGAQTIGDGAKVSDVLFVP